MLAVAFALLVSPSQDRPVVLFGARILTAAGQEFAPGTLVVAGGKIVAVGMQGAVAEPANAVAIDATGQTIIPGLVDTHSHLGIASRPGLGLNDVNEATGPIQSGGRALDAALAQDPGVRMATAGGITAGNIMPGSGNAIGGQTLYVKYRGRTIEEMRVEARGVLGGLKMANGENPKKAYGSKGQAPVTRMKVAALQRSEFVKAKEYAAKWTRWREKLKTDQDAPPPDRNVDLEPLVEVLERKRTVHFHCHRADDILTAVRIADEFGFELVVQHGTEAFKLADELAKRKIPVSMTIPDSPGGKAEVADLTDRCGAELHKKGVTVIVNTDDPVTDSRFLLRTAAHAVRGGLPADVALQAITRNPAAALHLDHRLGTLEAGKDADFAVLSGPPFSAYTQVRQTWIDGKKVFDAADAATRDYQTGGFLLPADQRPAPPKPLADRPALVRPQAAPKIPVGAAEFVVLAKLLHTVANGSIAQGAVHVKDGKIVFAGPAAQLAVPAGVPTIDAAVATPGLVDVFSQVPLSGGLNIAADQDQDEKSGPLQAELRVLDAFNPREPQLRFLLEMGVTVIHSCPGRANVLAGQTGVFRTHGDHAERMALRFPHALLVNLGNEPKTAYDKQKPGTRMAVANLVRKSFAEAQAYRLKRASKKDDGKPEHSPANEALALALEGKIGTVFAAQRADDILTALRLAAEFRLKPTLALATEAHLALDAVAASKAPVFVHPTLQIPFGPETIHTLLGNAALLADRGVPIALGSGMEAYVPKTRVVRYEAAAAMPRGLGYQRALRAITLDAANLLGVADRFGSLEPGKVADLVLYDGDPFEYATHVEAVFVDGKPAFVRADRDALPFVRRVWDAQFAEPGCCLFGL